MRTQHAPMLALAIGGGGLLHEEPLRRTLSLQFVLALTLVGALSIASFAVLTWVVSAQEADAPTINISGRQRMLSQRVSLMALRYATASDEEERRTSSQLLDDAIDLMAWSHAALVEGNDMMGVRERKSKRVEALYFVPTRLDQRVQAYLDDARALRALPHGELSAHHPILERMLQHSEKPLLRDLNEAVKAYEVEGTARVILLQWAQLGLLVLTVGLLVLEGVFLFWPMVQRIVTTVHELREKEATVRAQQESLKLVLDSTGDGLLPVDAEGNIRDGSSARVSDWFGPPKTGTPFWELLGAGDGDLADRFEMAFGQLAEGRLPESICISQMPSTLKHDQRSLALGYEPIPNGGGYLVKLRDVTTELAANAARRDAVEVQEIILRALRARDSFDAFVDETERLLTLTIEESPSERLQLLHTLKGNAGSFGFQRLSEQIHDAESQLSEDPDVDAVGLVERLRERWQHDLERTRRHLGPKDPGVWVHEQEHEAYVRALSERLPYPQLKATALQWRLEPSVRRLEHLASSARRVAAELDKELDVEVSDNWVRLPSRRLSPLWSSLVHVVRNAVDHGIEPPNVREACGKPRAGFIVFATRFEDAHLILEIRDDGAGIDWDALRARAREQGREIASKDDPTELLFADGLSSRTDVSSLSGRGTGMAALLRVVERLGGRVEVESTLGEGSTFRFRFPFTAIPELGVPRELAASTVV